MTSDIWGGNAPEVEGLDALTEYMADRGIGVRQVYHPSVELENGTVTTGHWVVVLEKRTHLEDGRVWLACLEMSNEAVTWSWPEAWGLTADLLGRKVPV